MHDQEKYCENYLTGITNVLITLKNYYVSLRNYILSASHIDAIKKYVLWILYTTEAWYPIKYLMFKIWERWVLTEAFPGTGVYVRKTK